VARRFTARVHYAQRFGIEPERGRSQFNSSGKQSGRAMRSRW